MASYTLSITLSANGLTTPYSLSVIVVQNSIPFFVCNADPEIVIDLTSTVSSSYIFPTISDIDLDPSYARLIDPTTLPSCITYDESRSKFTFMPPFPAAQTSYAIGYYLTDG